MQRNGSDPTKPPVISQTKRPRGLSLRSQLFTRSLYQQSQQLQRPAQKSPASITIEEHPPNQPTSDLPESQAPSQPDIELQPYSNNHPDKLAIPTKKYDPLSLANSTINLTSTYSSSINTPYPFKPSRKNRFVKSIKQFKDKILGVEDLPASENGRKIPVSIAHGNSASYFDSPYDMQKDRLIDERRGSPYCNNIITSAKYTVYSFIPKQLYAQFSKLANCYFMCVAIMQMIPSWSTTGTYTTIIPLLIFMSISIGREGYDDWRRHKQDREENSSLITILEEDKNTSPFDTQSIHAILNESATNSPNGTPTLAPRESTSSSSSSSSDEFSFKGTFMDDKTLTKLNIKASPIEWKDLKVGDIVRIKEDEWFPADILLLASTNETQEAFIETMALDGETNLKAKSPHVEMGCKCRSAGGLKSFKSLITIEDPNLDLYNFEGQFKLDDELFSLGPDNVIYRGSVLRNTSAIVGVVIFTGEETKIRMNNIKNPRVKAPKLQKSINYIVLFMVIVVMMLSAFSTMAERLYYEDNKNKAWYLYSQDAGIAPTLMGFIIMYNTLIPLSLYVTMEIIKVMQLLFIQFDIDLYDEKSNTPADAKTATILEELGQVSYIFSDKTGTLTDNLMIFRKFSICGVSWLHDLDLLLQDEGDEELTPFSPQPLSKRKSSISLSGQRKSTTSVARKSMDVKSIGTWKSNALPTKPQSTKNSLQLLNYVQSHPNTMFSQKAKFFLLSVALCNTCYPKKKPVELEDLDNDEEDEKIDFQSSSPDELALVQAARDLGFVVFDRQQNTLFLKTYPNGFENPSVMEEYQILDVIEFSSARKRMSVVVRFPNGRICLICKGADNIIIEKLRHADLASAKALEISKNSADRKHMEAELILNKAATKLSFDQLEPSVSISSSIRNSFGSNRGYERMTSIDNYLMKNDDDVELQQIAANSRKSLHIQQAKKYHIEEDNAGSSGNSTAVNDELDIPSEKLLLNDEYVIEKTLEHVEEYSTEGLRTLLYSYKWLDDKEYNIWSEEYRLAKTALVNRSEQIEETGAKIEFDFELAGATAIEDKLQDGVSEAIEKLRRAGIKMWMLTGDKRETAINIGYSCRLIKDYSKVIILNSQDGVAELRKKLLTAANDIQAGRVAHCVVVIDGATLSEIEINKSLMALFLDLCVQTDSVICCRASPSQKANMVSAVRNLRKKEVTLAIGDGANDIAMIQSADIGIGITGKEGLQAARASDYSIAQFRFLLKLLLVHGRYNYVRTSKFVLCTFYKEFLFYLTQAMYQRQTMFTGSSLYESWSLSMFNTLFTSLPVLCIGMFDKDLRPATLLAVPELYAKGRLYKQFNLKLFISWMLLSACQSVAITFLSWEIWGFSALKDNSVFPMGSMTFSVLVTVINIKCEFIEMQNRSWLSLAAFIISVGGWWLWNIIIMMLYRAKQSYIYFVAYGLSNTWGPDYSWWASLLALCVVPILFDVLVHVFKFIIMPNDEELFKVFEKDFDMRRYFEENAFSEMSHSWTWKKERSSFYFFFERVKTSLHAKLGLTKEADISNDEELVVNRKRTGTNPLIDSLPPTEPTVRFASNTDKNYEFETLPSGKTIRKRIGESGLDRLAKKLARKGETDEDIDAIIVERLANLQEQEDEEGGR